MEKIHITYTTIIHKLIIGLLHLKKRRWVLSINQVNRDPPSIKYWQAFCTLGGSVGSSLQSWMHFFPPYQMRLANGRSMSCWLTDWGSKAKAAAVKPLSVSRGMKVGIGCNSGLKCVPPSWLRADPLFRWRCLGSFVSVSNPPFRGRFDSSVTRAHNPDVAHMHNHCKSPQAKKHKVSL